MKKRFTHNLYLNNIRAKLLYCLLLLAIMTSNVSSIKLDSKLLTLVDGSFINANRIEEIKRFTVKIHGLLKGELQPDGTRIGGYSYQNTMHSLQTLHALENESGANQELMGLLEQARNDFMLLSDQFRDSAQNAKSFTAELIEASCDQRNRPDSTLRTWAQTSVEKEHIVFKKEITSFKKLTMFLTDLCNFFTDLQDSCPKACALFQSRVAKYTATKKLLPLELEKYYQSNNQPIDKTAFLAHLKRKHLDSLTLEEITPKTVQVLLKAFAQTKGIPLDTE